MYKNVTQYTNLRQYVRRKSDLPLYIGQIHAFYFDTTPYNKLFKKMKQHPNSKTTQHYKDIDHQIQRETRQSYWNYLENIICYDENTETSQKQKKILELHKQH